MKQYLSLALLLLVIPAKAATYYVAIDGNNSNPGTKEAPFLTIEKGLIMAQPGDTVMVGEGVYSVVVKTERAGLKDAPITLDGQGVATIERFVSSHAHNRLQNMKVTGHRLTNRSLVSIGHGAHFNVVSNVFVDGGLIANIGGIGLGGASVKPFDDNAASHCLIISNRITRIVGSTVMSTSGNFTIFQGNEVFDVGQCDFLRLWGRTNIVRGNIFRNNYRVEGIGNHIDFVQTFGNNGNGSQGHIIEGNLVQGVQGQLAQLEGNLMPEIGDWVFRNNAFVDIELQASITIPGIKFYNNVFYRCNTINGSHPLSFGTRVYGAHSVYSGESGTNFAHRAEVINNVFLGCGDDRDSRGWYAISAHNTNSAANFNFVAKLNFAPVAQDSQQRYVGDPRGWDFQRWWEPNGINGGNPRFVAEGTLDFRLREESPLIGAGLPLNHLFATDGRGYVRGAKWDIGALEFRADDLTFAPTAPRGVRVFTE